MKNFIVFELKHDSFQIPQGRFIHKTLKVLAATIDRSAFSMISSSIEVSGLIL
jgi:hypothetical protein